MFGVPCPIKTERQFVNFIQTGKHEKRNSLSTKGQIVISLHFPQSETLKDMVKNGKNNTKKPSGPFQNHPDTLKTVRTLLKPSEKY